MAFALSLTLDPTFWINFYKTLCSAQLDYIKKLPLSHNTSIPTDITSSFHYGHVRVCA